MSSILEKLMILIQLDASGLKQGADQVESASNKMTHALENTAHHGNFLEHVFGHLKRELLGFTVSMIGFGAALEGIKGSFDYFNKLGGAADKLQVNVELLDAWNEAVIKAGGTADSFDESIKHVAGHFNTSNATILKVLPQFADLFHRLNNTQAMNYGKKIGFDEATIQLLHQGGKAVDEIIEKQKHLGVITKEQKDILDKYTKAWGDAKQQFRLAAFETELILLPALTKVITFLGETVGYFEKHPTFVKSFVISLAAMGIAAKIFGITVEGAGAEAAIGWTALLGPLALVAAAISLIIDDIVAWKRGDESVTGEIVKRWPEVGRVINLTIDGAIETSKALFWLWKKEFDILEKIIEEIEGAYSKISKLIQGGTIKGSFSSSYDSRILGYDINSTKKALSGISNHPINSYVSGIPRLGQSIPQKNVTINVGDITINTQAIDAQAISSAIGKGLYDHLFQAQSQLDDGQVI
jgi:hypothetical protein